MQALFLILLQGSAPPIDAEAFVEFASIPAPVGREEALRDAIRARLPEWAEPHVWENGNLVVELGPGGRASRILLAPIGDPALEVAGFHREGYLRVRHVERRGLLLRLAWVEGRPVTVLGAANALEGVALVNSLHLRGKRPDTVGAEWIRIDIGAASEGEATGRGVNPGDRIAPRAHITRLADGSCAGWFVGRRACAFALAEALRGLDPASLPERTALVWSTEVGEKALRPSISDLYVPLDAGPSSEPVARAQQIEEGMRGPGPLVLRTAGLGSPVERVWVADLPVLIQALRETVEAKAW